MGRGGGMRRRREIKIRQGKGFHYLTAINSRETDILPSSDEDNNYGNSQQLSREEGAEQGNRKRQALRSPPVASS